jgi:hypothetical protein
MATKKISVNPAFLKINGSKTLKKRERKERRIRDDLHKKQNNELKKGLLEKIKTHKKRKQEERKRLQQEMKQMGDVDANELDKSLDYLHQLSNKHKSKKQKKRELKLARKMERQSRIEQSISQTNQTPLISNPYTSTQPPAIKPSASLQPPLININTIQTPSQPTVQHSHRQHLLLIFYPTIHHNYNQSLYNKRRYHPLLYNNPLCSKNRIRLMVF